MLFLALFSISPKVRLMYLTSFSTVRLHVLLGQPFLLFPFGVNSLVIGEMCAFLLTCFYTPHKQSFGGIYKSYCPYVMCLSVLSCQVYIYYGETLEKHLHTDFLRPEGVTIRLVQGHWKEHCKIIYFLWKNF